jgi:uncharacterized protein
VIVPAYEIERRMPFFFKSASARAAASHDFPMWQVARATSAAPTYFEPARIDASSEGDYWALIDGGVYANNPAICALVEARTTTPAPDGYTVFSLGTGVRKRRIPYADARRWGLARWAKPVFDIVLDGASETVDYQLRQLLPAESYLRLQPALDRDTDSMDDATPDNLRNLRLIGEALIRERSRDLERMAESLLGVPARAG